MGTGIVSVALADDHQHVLSLVLLVLTAVAWVVIGALLAWQVLHDRAAVRRAASSPAALTGVAATAVLGARVGGIGWSVVAIVLLVIATGLWLALIWPVLRALPRRGGGVSFMVTVSTASLAVLVAQLAVSEHAAWLLDAALVLLVAALAGYALVLAGLFGFRQLLDGQGDHWVSGGALAISTLAVAQIVLAARGLHELAGSVATLKTITLVLWAASIAWLPALIVGELIRPRPRYDVRRWATVFPVGMYAACSFAAGRAARVHGLLDFAEVWVWVGFAVWLVVLVAMLDHAGFSPRPGPPRISRATRSS